MKQMTTFGMLLPEQETAPETKAEQPAPAEPQNTEVTLDDIRKVLAEKSRSGFKDAVKSLLKKYNADKVSGLPEGNYAEILKEAEQIGN